MLTSHCNWFRVDLGNVSNVNIASHCIQTWFGQLRAIVIVKNPVQTIALYSRWIWGILGNALYQCRQFLQWIYYIWNSDYDFYKTDGVGRDELSHNNILHSTESVQMKATHQNSSNSYNSRNSFQLVAIDATQRKATWSDATQWVANQYKIHSSHFTTQLISLLSLFYHIKALCFKF